MQRQRNYMMTREKFLSLLLRQQQSGLSVIDFCENEGYSRTRFYFWKQQYNITEQELSDEAARMGVPDGLAPIQLNAGSPQSYFSEYAPQGPSVFPQPLSFKRKDDSEIFLELPNGLKLNFKGQAGCRAALNLILKIYNANVLPQ